MINESFDSEQLWGENDDTNQEFSHSWSKDVLNNIEQTVIIDSIQPVRFKSSFYNGENVINSSSRKELDVILFDDVMKRTCKLLKYRNDLKEITEKGKFQHDLLNLDKLKKDDPDDAEKNNGSVQFYKHESSNFVEGIFIEPLLEMTSESALKVLRSCVSTVLAFIGFSTTTMLPLQLLTEVTEDYIKRMTKLLHVNVEKEILEGESGFSDALDRTCHEMGIGSIRNLTQYFKEETLSLNSKRIKEYKEDLGVYEEVMKKLRDVKRQTSELSFVKMDDDDLVIPELHLTSISGSDMSSEPFEAGLQMLQTLERQQMNMDLSSQPSCSSSSMMDVELTSVKNELEDVKTFKRKRK